MEGTSETAAGTRAHQPQELGRRVNRRVDPRRRQGRPWERVTRVGASVPVPADRRTTPAAFSAHLPNQAPSCGPLPVCAVPPTASASVRTRPPPDNERRAGPHLRLRGPRCQPRSPSAHSPPLPRCCRSLRPHRSLSIAVASRTRSQNISHRPP